MPVGIYALKPRYNDDIAGFKLFFNVSARDFDDARAGMVEVGNNARLGTSS